ncbi:NAD(P)/FAD-dependent oxidoreductase [Candidatus Saccharibacteria bacterium]|nr:NAD(P)/FAD-dependent oxidoreductase [Candidatus Saccharibacteria bacterium]MBR3253293.1 NAD(P)/FAD-dependent oxidoreductase [Candidatus Saccharibacteria bacterium]
MGRKYDFEYIVIGSGPAGSAAALILAKTRKKVALVEGKFFGGSNLNTRDVPYAVALDFSHTYSKLLSLPEFKNQDFSLSLPTAVSHQLKSVLNAGGNDSKPFEEKNITCIRGYANFLDQNTIAVGEKKYTASTFILATGSRLKTLEIAGTKTVNYLTPENALKIRRLPKVAVVVGGGSTGCEIAEYYAELGVKVIILEMSSRLLPREDKEVGELMTDYFTKELGILVCPNCKVVALEKDNENKRVIFQNARSEKMVLTDCVILATGSTPSLDYGLENAGIKYKNSGIVVDKYFQTSAKNIYAIGDCLGNESSSTERADYEGTLVASNLANRAKTLANYKGFIRSTDTLPEIAVVGLNEDDLTKRDRKYLKTMIKLEEVNASKIYNFNYGFIKLLTNKNYQILGATIVAPNAKLIAEEIALARRHNLTALELASTPHPINDYSYIVKLATKKILK